MPFALRIAKIRKRSVQNSKVGKELENIASYFYFIIWNINIVSHS